MQIQGAKSELPKDNWFYSKNGKSRVGPVTLEEIASLASHKELKPTDMIWCDSLPNWVQVQNILRFEAVPQVPQIEKKPPNYIFRGWLLVFSLVGAYTLVTGVQTRSIIDALLIGCSFPYAGLSVNKEWKKGNIQAAKQSSRHAAIWIRCATILQTALILLAIITRANA